jgi:replication factor C subunit 1
MLHHRILISLLLIYFLRSFLGQNSKRQKLARLLGDIQIKMRLKVSGSRDEVRQDYMPILASKIVLPLTEKGAAAVG